jgi:hypothetical protein
MFFMDVRIWHRLQHRLQVLEHGLHPLQEISELLSLPAAEAVGKMEGVMLQQTAEAAAVELYITHLFPSCLVQFIL